MLQRLRNTGKSERILVAHVLPWPTVGGVEAATRRVTQATADGVFEHVVFRVPGADQVSRFFDDVGVANYEYRPVEPSYRHFLPYFKGSLALAREFKRLGVSLIHCSDLLAGFHAALAGRLAGIRVLCHIRCIASGLSKRDQSFLYLVDHFAFVSKDTWRQFGFDVPERKGTVIYDGYELSSVPGSISRECILKTLETPANVSVVGMVARVAEAKDYFTLAQAASKVIKVNPGVRFLIVGDNSGTENYRKHYEKVKGCLAELQIEDYFIFVGHQDNVDDFFHAMDIFVLSTHEEGLPLAIMEAMAHGLPVIATRVGGIPEIVQHGRTGLLHEHEDADTFANQILNLLENKALRGKMGMAAREEIASKWTIKRFGDDVSKLYKKLVGFGRARTLVDSNRGQDKQ